MIQYVVMRDYSCGGKVDKIFGEINLSYLKGDRPVRLIYKTVTQW